MTDFLLIGLIFIVYVCCSTINHNLCELVKLILEDKI